MPRPTFFLLISALVAPSFPTDNVTPVNILLPLNATQLSKFTVSCTVNAAERCLWRLNISLVDNAVISFEVSLSTSSLEQLYNRRPTGFSVSFYRNSMENLIMKCDQQSYSCRLKADRDDIIFMGVDAAAINEDNDGDKDNKQIATKEDSNENQLQIQLVLDVVADDQCTCGDTVHNLWTTFDKANIKSPRGCKKPISCIHYITSKLLFSHVYLSNVPGNINQIKPPNKLIIFDGPSVDYNAVIAGLPCGTNAISMQYSCIWTSQSVISSQQSLTVQLLSDGTNSLNIDLQFQANFAEIPVSSTCGPTNYYLLRPISAVTLNVSLLLEDIHITTCQWNAASYPSRQLGFSVQKLQLSTGSELQVNYFNTTIASCTGSSDQSECNGVSVGNNLTATLRLARFIIPISFQAVILDHLAGARTRQCYADVIFLVESSSLIRNNELLDSVMSMFDQLFLGGGYNRIAVIAYGANMTNNVFLFDSIPYPSLQQYALLNAFLPQPQTSSCSEISLGQGLIAAYDVFLNASFDREKHIVIFSSGCMSSANNPAGVAQIFQTLVNTTIYAVDFSKTSINSNLTLENITANVFHQDDFNEISTLILQSAVSNSCHSIIDAPTTSRPSVTTPITPPPPISCPFNNTQIYSDRITIVLLVEDSQTVQTDFNFLRSDWEAIINLTYTLVPDATWISGYVFAFLNSSSFGVSMNHFNTTAQLISHMNATMPMQSNQSSINLYEAMDTIQQRVASRLLFLILTKNNVTDFSGFHQKAETSIASYGSFAVLMTSAELCAELDRCPFGTIFFSSSGQILMLQAQPNTAAIAASLASFYKQQLLHFHFENNCTSCSTEFAFNIDLGISDVVNIAVYGQFGNSGSISAFASVDSGETTRPLSDVTVYVETSYQRICRIPLNQLYSNESIITISLKLSAGISDRIFATVRGRTKPGFENYIGFSSDAATDFVQSVPGEDASVLVTRNNNNFMSYEYAEVYSINTLPHLQLQRNQSFEMWSRICAFNQYGLEPISCQNSNYLILQLWGTHDQSSSSHIQRLFFLRCNNSAILTTTPPPILTTMTTTTTIATTTTTTSTPPSSSNGDINTTPTLTISTSPNASANITSSSLPSIQSSTIPTPPTTSSGLTNHLEGLANGNITNVTSVLEDVNRALSGNGSNLNSADLYYCSLILNKAANVPNLTHDDFGLFLNTVDTLLFADDSAYISSDDDKRNTTDRILDSFTPLIVNSPDEVSYITGENVAMTAHLVKCSTNENGQQVSTNNNGLSDTGGAFVTNAAGGSSSPVASITIPDAAICNSGAYKASFMIFRNLKLFDQGGNQMSRQKRSSDTTDSNSDFEDYCANKLRMRGNNVLTATLLSSNDTSNRVISALSNPTTMAVVQYNVKNWDAPLHGDYGTAWWTGDDWSDDGCQPMSTNDGHYTGHCTHLTDFALIVTGVQKDPSLCEGVLKGVGYVLSGSSSLTLFVLLGLFTAASVPALREIPLLRKLTGSNTSNGILGLPYLSTLFAYFFFFTVFIDRTVINAGSSLCNAIAAFLYTCLISTIFWTIFQGLEIVKRFYTFTKLGNVLELITKPQVTVAVCMALPISLTIALWFSAKNFFDRDDCFCWVRPDYVTFAVVVPTSLLVVADIIFTGLIVQQFYFNRAHHDRFSRRIQSNSAQKRQRTQKIIVLASMQIILGAPWVLQYLTIGTANLTVWHYLFTIINGSQGFLLGVMYVLMRYNRHAAHKRQQEATSSVEDSNVGRRFGRHAGLVRTDTAQEIISDSPTQSARQSTLSNNNSVSTVTRQRILPEDDDTNGYFS